MRIILTFSGFFILPALLFTQSTELSVQHGLLTNDCKYIRGHAGRVIAEASEAELNIDVAAAHCREVMKYQSSMEQKIRETKELLKPGELKTVEAEYESMEKTCATVKELAAKLLGELQKERPDRATVRKIGSDLKREMSSGYDVHEQMKKKLGL